MRAWAFRYDGLVGFLARVWGAIRDGKRPATTVELLQRAERARRESRFQEAEQLVAQVLDLDLKNVLGHLLAGYLHAAARRTDQAKSEFRTVLSLDPEHPRAMLGLARMDFEGGDLASCQNLLERALRVYPDFPEARALLDLVLSLAAAPAAADRAAAPSPELRLQRLPLPDGTRECLIVETDGTVLFSHPVSRTREALAAHLVRVAGIASATLARAGLGPLRRAAVGSNSGTTFVQGDARLILSLTLPPDVAVVAAQRETDALWAKCLEELGAGARKGDG